MDNQIKFNDEEIKKVTSFQQQYNDLQRNFGSLSLNKIKLKEQLEEINKAKQDLEQKFIDIQKNEKDFLNEITKKYGDGTLDLETGIYTKTK